MLQNNFRRNFEVCGPEKYQRMPAIIDIHLDRLIPDVYYFNNIDTYIDYFRA